MKPYFHICPPEPLHGGCQTLSGPLSQKSGMAGRPTARQRSCRPPILTEIQLLNMKMGRNVRQHESRRFIQHSNLESINNRGGKRQNGNKSLPHKSYLPKGLTQNNHGFQCSLAQIKNRYPLSGLLCVKTAKTLNGWISRLALTAPTIRTYNFIINCDRDSCYPTDVMPEIISIHTDDR